MSRKKLVRVTNDMKTKVLEYMSDGLDIATMCRLDNKLPTPTAIRNAQVKDKEFNDAVTRGYEIILQGYADEIMYISGTPLTTLYPDLDFKEAAEAAKRRISALQQLLRDYAPTISNRFSKVQKIEHSGEITNNQPIINIMSFARPNDMINVTNSAIEHRE